MSDEKLKLLLEELFEKKITKKFSSGGGNYKTEIVLEEGRVLVEQIIRKHLLDDREEKIGVLQAKVFTYEKIISNSNFAPILDNKTNQIDEG